MCQYCDKQVIEMGILESDLPGLPFKPAKWICIVKGCHHSTKIRDYGIAPFYFWPVKVVRAKDGSWRGGWTDLSHGYICGKHFPEYKKYSNEFFRNHARAEKELNETIIHITQKKKNGKSRNTGFGPFTY